MWSTGWIKDFFRKADIVLLILILAASLFGVALIYSATRYLGHSGTRYVIIQIAAILLGVVAYFLMSFADIELFTEKTWKWMLGFNIVFILLLIPFGAGGETVGNNNWLPIPFLPINVQPAEVAKVFFVLLLAYQCVKLQEHGISRFTSVVQLAGHTLLMVGIIAVVSGDFGMVMVYLGIFIIVAWAAGVKKRWFLLGLVVMVAAVVVVWPHVPSYIQGRFTVVIDHITGNADTLYEQTQGDGWQQSRSILAIGSGGLFGQGYLQGTQTQSTSSSALPARHTDEIFAVCGEELGMVGCLAVILLLAAIIYRCFWVARRACSPMSAYVATGYAGMLLLQTCINIGFCLYVFPVVGLTLPFFSYGGSSIITLYACMGIVSNIKMRSLPSWLRDRSQI
ncbi:MAG TPA: FtsW/RodA/SpoVE family cell cycle protein [Candidatus Intestinimonas stercoravium]|uniref:FtsW/RodA/SpoVE family cell cycle protein n=1 Tax=uncultured Intestinimonas sp. TaxID=1689265 RepID=UPI001F8CB6A6|nr:FtsW/RodA/SpoVE family cell cycle protein [uncultured Intestinimonas sp.]HJA63222.1 FtsW/RodA/SpoVE family cell cycle protein [Candidatus Intestinimonas stercoravium]